MLDPIPVSVIVTDYHFYNYNKQQLRRYYRMTYIFMWEILRKTPTTQREREREKGGELKIITIPQIKVTTTKPGYSTTKGCPRCIFAIVFERSGVSANKARIRPTSSSTVKSIKVPSSKRYETSAIDASCEIEYIVKIKRTRYKAGSY